jgi:small subunit ribosomal protein S17
MEARKPNKTERGIVVSDGGTKSIRVELHWTYKHPKYGKYLKRSTKVGVHDEKSEAKVGDTVDITQCRPISKTKTWRLVKVVERAVQE